MPSYPKVRRSYGGNNAGYFYIICQRRQAFGSGSRPRFGITVWWDAELVGSDDFYEVILEALRQAKAAIVIWSNVSAKSRFVRDEARYALHLAKLIAVKTLNLDFYDIPFGFQSQHADKLEDREHIEDSSFWILKQATSPSAPDNRSGQKAAEYAFQRTCRIYFESGRNLEYSG